jgi:hypothetical protein
VALWPGLPMSDTVSVVGTAHEGRISEWFSAIYALLAISTLDVVPHVAAMVVLQIAVTAALMAYASALLLRRTSRRLPLLALNLVAAVSAPLIVNSLMVTRDALFGAVHVMLALYVADAVVRRSISRGGLAGVVLVTGFLSVLRGDGIALLLAVPLVLLALRPTRRQIAVGAAAFLASFALFAAVLPAVLKIDPGTPHAYQLTLRVNPLAAVLNSDFYSPSKEADLAALGRMIDVEAFRQRATPGGIPAYWAGSWNHAASDADYEAFRTVADRLLLDNAGIVLGNRLQAFTIAGGLGTGQFTGTSIATATAREQGQGASGEPGLGGAPPSASLYNAAADPLRESGAYRGLLSWRAALQWNFLPWLLLLAAVLPFWRRARMEAIVALIVLSRVPLVFVAAPAAQYKYYYSVLLGGLVVAALLLARLRRT